MLTSVAAAVPSANPAWSKNKKGQLHICQGMVVHGANLRVSMLDRPRPLESHRKWAITSRGEKEVSIPRSLNLVVLPTVNDVSRHTMKVMKAVLKSLR